VAATRWSSCLQAGEGEGRQQKQRGVLLCMHNKSASDWKGRSNSRRRGSSEDGCAFLEKLRGRVWVCWFSGWDVSTGQYPHLGLRCKVGMRIPKVPSRGGGREGKGLNTSKQTNLSWLYLRLSGGGGSTQALLCLLFVNQLNTRVIAQGGLRNVYLVAFCCEAAWREGWTRRLIQTND